MAGLKIIGKLAEGSGGILNKAMTGMGKNGQGEPEGSLSSIKKQINDLLQEKSKLYGVIGMEACDLHTEGKLQSGELELYFEKMTAVSEKLDQLEEARKRLETKAQKNNICECGFKLSKNDKFCPSCGRKVDNGTVTCTCGTEVKTTMKFCPNCGTPVENLLAAESQTEPDMECICGAKIKPGQFMCMECGRRFDPQK